MKCGHYNSDKTFGKLFPRALYEAVIHGYPGQKQLNREHKKELAGYKIRKDELPPQ